MVYIFLFTGLIVLGVMYSINISATKPNNNILMGVTLPYMQLKDEKVLGIISRFKRENRYLSIFSILLIIPILFIKKYDSISLIYFFIWIFSLIGFSDALINKYIKLMMELKRKNNWYVGEKNIVRIDTKVTLLKDSMPLSILWFIPSIVISIFYVIRTFINRNNTGNITVYIALVGLLSILLYIFLYRKYCNIRPSIYSSDSEVNILCNSIYKKKWSLCWIGVSTCNSIALSLIIEGVIRGETLGVLLGMLGTFIMTFTLIIIIYTQGHIKDAINKIVYASEDRLFTDADEYWENGYYCNPHDKRIMVEKRIGTGMCFNLGNKKGKFFNYAGIIFATVIVLVVSFFILRFDICGFEMNISGEIVNIEAPVYGMEFNVDEIESIELINEIPRIHLKTNGVGSSSYNLGYFKLEGYGNVPIYIYKDNPPYLKIKLKDKYVFLNGKTSEETKKYYEEINKKMGY